MELGNLRQLRIDYVLNSPNFSRRRMDLLPPPHQIYNSIIQRSQRLRQRLWDARPWRGGGSWPGVGAPSPVCPNGHTLPSQVQGHAINLDSSWVGRRRTLGRKRLAMGQFMQVKNRLKEGFPKIYIHEKKIGIKK